MNHNYLLTDNKMYSIHLMLTNQCNNRCTYCGQYADYSDDEFSLEKLQQTVLFFREAHPQIDYTFFLEGGEPTLYTHLGEFLAFLEEIGEKVVLLTNGRPPKEKYSLLLQYLKKGTIKHIGLHVPVGKEPFTQIWNTEAYNFMQYLHQNNIKGKVAFLGLLHNVEASRKDIWNLLRWFTYFPGLFFTIEVAFPHPSPLKKNYMNYTQRKESMKYLMRFFDFCIQKKIQIGLGGFMLCLIDYGLAGDEDKYKSVQEYFLDRRTYMSHTIEMHVLIDGSVTILCNAKDDTFVKIDTIFDMKNFSEFQNISNTIIEELSLEKQKNIPEQCGNCDYLGNGCAGDHFNLISEYEQK